VNPSAQLAQRAGAVLPCRCHEGRLARAVCWPGRDGGGHLKKWVRARGSRGWIHGPGNDGFIKLIADTGTGILIGATSAGLAGGEVLDALAVAVHARVPVTTLSQMIYAYPTFHRAIETIDQAEDRAVSRLWLCRCTPDARSGLMKQDPEWTAA
jgi:hypothetical protein